MSEPLPLALVVEGETDQIMLEAAFRSLLAGRDFVLTVLQPERSAAFPSLTGEGWAGVYRWCRQIAEQGSGRVANSPLFQVHAMLVVQLDADVAASTYQGGHIDERVQDLPCDKPCPPPSDTTNALRTVLLRWMGETSVPQRTILCTPSKNLEAWILTALYPTNRVVTRGEVECRETPESLLAGKPAHEKLVRGTGGGYKKNPQRYRLRALDFQLTWPSVRKTCTEAERFSLDFLTALAAVALPSST